MNRSKTGIAALAIAFMLWPLLAAAELVVGQVAPLSGVLASTGEQMVLGARLWFDHINSQGGVHGRKIRHVVRDDGYRIDDTVAQTRALIEGEKPLALIGFAGTANVGQLLSQGVLKSKGIALVGPYTGGEPLRTPFNSDIFHIRAGYADEAEYMVDQLLTTGMSRIAVLYQNDAFGQAGLDGIEAALAQRGTKPVAKATYERNTADVGESVRQLLVADVQAVVLIAVNKAAAAFAKAYRAGGGTAQIISISVVNPAELVRLAGLDSVRGLGITQVVPHPSSMIPAAREFRELLKKHAPDAEPTYTAFEEFIAARILTEALRRAGANPTPGRVALALESLGKYDAGGFLVDFSPRNRIGSRFVELTVIGREGKLLR